MLQQAAFLAGRKRTQSPNFMLEQEKESLDDIHSALAVLEG